MKAALRLEELGWSDWFTVRADSVLTPGQEPARVMTVDRGSYLVRGEELDCPAELSGRFRHAVESSPDLPCVGDWVGVERASPELAIIHQVLPRNTVLRRKRPGKAVNFQMLAANLDVALIVQSCHFDFNVRRLERYLVVAREGGIEPILALSKTDLVTPDELDGLIGLVRAAGIQEPVLPLSNETGDGLDGLQELLEPGRTFGLLGSSGVGKSTLVNRLLGREALDTRAVSGTGEGVHTTSRRQLLLLENGALLIDTPGMRELGLLGASDGLDDSFAEVQDLARGCRFGDCTHTQEPGCAVLAALEAGELDEDRYRSYHKLKRETEFHDLSYVEKRKKDRELGRFYRSVLKDKKR